MIEKLLTNSTYDRGNKMYLESSTYNLMSHEPIENRRFRK